MGPLDTTNTVPVTGEFVHELRRRQGMYEAQYCFLSLDAVLARQARRSGGHGSTASLNSSRPAISHPCNTFHFSPCFSFLTLLLLFLWLLGEGLLHVGLIRCRRGYLQHAPRQD
jgi:hypothetical protein